jgi:hypothetical protein
MARNTPKQFHAGLWLLSIKNANYRGQVSVRMSKPVYAVLQAVIMRSLDPTIKTDWSQEAQHG